mgnify:CR=1 FL=1
MIRYLYADQLPDEPDLARSMFQDRAAQFAMRLGWDVRITSEGEERDQYDALNYNRWHICDPACQLGKSLQVPLYAFLKDALVRKYGEAWYEELIEDIEGSK